MNDTYRAVMNHYFEDKNDKRTHMRKGEWHGVDIKFKPVNILKGKLPISVTNSMNIGPGTDIINRLSEYKQQGKYNLNDDKLYKDYVKGMTQSSRSSLRHDLNYLTSKNSDDIKKSDQLMSGKLLNNLSILKPIESLNNIIYGSAIRLK